ncbi:MAG: ABC transporter substrate-binding protein [Desulfatitalea sp.]|nr:ABC transporter substrate-binding protein [Desulfatitalea sp.]NNJ99363.1 ABC transporter substrate-binding protein [Desulfatitalea sp.]
MRRLLRYLMSLVLVWPAWMAVAAAEAIVVDDGGRRITVQRPFARIISLYGAHTENLFFLGAGGQIIGRARHDDWPPDAAAKPVFSYHDHLEKFLAVQPDLVLIRPMIDRGYSRLMAQLERHGITVVSLQPNTVAEMFAYWRTLGALVGRETQAERMAAQFQTRVAAIRRLTGAVPEKKRVYFEAIHGRMRTFAPGSGALFALDVAGGINVAGDAVPRRGTTIADFGKERLLARGDSIDVYLAQVGPMNRPTVAMIKNEAGYELIRAVRDDQVFLVEEQLVSRPTMRMLSGICRISRILYPRLFTDTPDAAACGADDDAVRVGRME